MNGSKFFLWQAQTLASMDRLRNTTSRVICTGGDYPALSLESLWENADPEIEQGDLVEDKAKKQGNYCELDSNVGRRQTGIQMQKESIKVALSDRNEVSRNRKCLPIIRKTSEIRMQEIEKIITENAIFRNIDENLCMWNGRYYRQLDETSFVKAVRKLMPKEQQDRISRFGRFREAYEYMLANEKLKKQFTSENVATAKHMIVFRNGMYNAETNELIPHSHKYPVLFEVDAHYLGNGKVDTPCMDSIINSATQYDQEILKRFYQCLGYIYAQGNEAKKFFVFGTAPDSGKSIIGEFIGKTLGDHNISTISLNNFGARFALGNIGQKVLNYNMDLPAAELDTGVVQKLKQLTGDARIDCEEKYVQVRTVMHHCKFLFATNHPIRLKQSDEAFYRRLLLIPFIYSVTDEDKDHQLSEKLWKERDAIVTKAAHAYRKLYKDNFIFAESVVADNMLDAWKSNCDSSEMKDFFDEYCEVLPNDSMNFVPTEEIFKCYQQYCKEHGKVVSESEKPQFSRKFRKEFDIPSAKRRIEGYNSPVNGYFGIRLRRED